MMNEGVSEDLYDYEEPRGRLQILLHRTRWRWILAGILALSFAIPFVIAHIVVPEDDVLPPNSPLLLMSPTAQPLLLQQQEVLSSSSSSKKSKGKNPKSQKVGDRSNGKNGEYKFTGGGSGGSLASFTDFEGLIAACSLSADSATDNNGNSNDKSKTFLASISLSNVNLDAAQFSHALEGCYELESISLENVSLIGNFTRVFLPKLNKFVYVQNADDKRDSYKSPETLHQTLFFDKQLSPSPSWDVVQDLLNLGVDITVCKGGTRLIDIQRSIGEVYLNVKYCESVLLNAKGTYDSLTLINCNVTEASIPVIPSTLKYLNVRNAVQRSPHLAQLLQRLVTLEELYVWLTFHCDWPGYELFLNFNDLPQTIKTVGINNVDTTYLPGESTSTSIKSLTVGDYTTNTTVSQGFPLLLRNLERLNVVNMSDPSPAAGYNIIHTAIKMGVKEIAVVNLHRNYSAVIANETEMLNVETVLDHAGIPKAPLSCFILQMNGNNTAYSGRKLTTQEQHQIRYNGLGFNKMDSWEDYLKWDAL